jgi:DNA-binding transcriptional LysR family regulator
LDLRQITYFVALFEEGSVTRAAQRVHVVQPALSTQIAKLERELNHKLFERAPKAMEPTAAARTLFRLVRPILRDLAQAREQMALLSSTVSGRVTVGVLSSLASSIVPTVLARFAAAFPQGRSVDGGRLHYHLYRLRERRPA